MAQTIAVTQVTETDTARTIVPVYAGNYAWPLFSGTRTDVSLDDDLDALALTANPGDVLVLAPGAHVISGPISPGVTIIGSPCITDTYDIEDSVSDQTGSSSDRVPGTVLIVFTGFGFTLGDGCTLRDLSIIGTNGSASRYALTVAAGSSAWVENCYFPYGKVMATGPEAGESVTFSRCSFTSLSAQYFADTSALRTGKVRLENCLLVEGRTVTTDALIELAGQDLEMAHCTVIGATNLIDMANGDIDIRNCVFTEGVSALLSTSGNVTGTGNWSTASSDMPVGVTVATKSLSLHEQSYAPTNESPFARGGADSDYTPMLDKNYLPYSTTAPSAGCYQWQAQGSCLYKPRFLDPVSGFSLTYGGQTLSDAYDAATTEIGSHLCLAAIMRSFVADLIHPSRGHFYVTYDGQYILALHDDAGGTFSLSTTASSGAANAFGTVSLSEQRSTEFSPAYYYTPGGASDYAEASTNVAARIIFPGGSIGSFTVLMWAKQDTSNGFNFWSCGTFGGDYIYSVAAGRVEQDVEAQDGGVGAGTVYAELPGTSAWAFCAMTCDGSTLRGYGDGVESANSAVSGTYGAQDVFVLFSSTADDTLLGIAPGETGSLRNIAIFGRALSATEVAALYAAGETHDYRNPYGSDWAGEAPQVHWYESAVAGVVPNSGTGGTCNLVLNGDVTSNV